jgi:DHA2 family multidrug resistance protein
VDVTSAYSPSFANGVHQLESIGMSTHQAQGAIARQITGQAYLLSATDLFWLCGWTSFALVALVWLARKPAAMTGPIAAD